MHNKRWVSLASGTAMLLFLGLIYAWSIFKAPLAQLYPKWSESQISLTFTISIISLNIFGFISGQLIKKIQARTILRIAAVLLLLGFMGVSMLNVNNPSKSLLLLYFFYGVLGAGGVGFGYNSIISFVTKNFQDKTGLASGIMLMGFGLGGIALGSVVSGVIGNIGLFKAFRILAIMIAIILFAGSFTLKGSSEQANNLQKKDEDGIKNYTTTEMLKQPNFWAFVLWNVLGSSAGLLIINNAAPIAVAFGAPATLGLIVSLFNGAGRVMLGTAFDKLGENKSLTVNTLCVLAASLLLLGGAISKSAVLVVIGLVFTGIGYGGAPALSSAYINKMFGPKNFPANFSTSNFSVIPAAIIGPMISSKLISQAGGTYNTTFIFMLGLALVAVLMLTFLLKATAKFIKK